MIVLEIGSKPKNKKMVHGLYLFFPSGQRENLSHTQFYYYHKSFKEIDQSSKKSPPFKMTFTPLIAPYILIFSLCLHYPSHHCNNLGHFFCIPPTKYHQFESSNWWKLLLLLLECPSPPPSFIMSLQQKI